MNRSTLLYILIFSLMLNAAVVGSAVVLWWKKPAQASESSLCLKSVQQFIKEDLKLDAAKTVQLIAMANRKREEIQNLRISMQALRSEMMELISAESLDEAAVEHRLVQMDQMQFQVRRSGIGTLTQIAQMLGPEDRKEFGAYLKQRICGCGPLSPGGRKGPFEEDSGGR